MSSAVRDGHWTANMQFLTINISNAFLEIFRIWSHVPCATYLFSMFWIACTFSVNQFQENTERISLYSKILQYISYRISTYWCSIWQLSIFDYIPLTICSIFTSLVYSLSTLFIEQLNSHYSEHYSVILVYSGRVAEWHVDLLVPSSALHITKWG